MVESTDTDRMTRESSAVLTGLALVYFLLEWLPSFSSSYGYYIDELYYLACSEHPALGYVDHPPLSILLLQMARAVFGDSVPALRLVPSLAGAATVFLTGLIARRLGTGVFGQALAAGAVMAAPVYHVMFGFYSMNALAFLIWALCFWILVEIERRNDARLWLALGAVAGLGLENKHTIVLLALGLAAGLVLTRARRHLAGRWLWIGLAMAIALALPNLFWQMGHGWPSLEFYRNADSYKNVPTPAYEVLKQQVLAMNPAALPIWLAGLTWLLFANRGQSYRHLGWTYVVLLLLMLLGQKSRPDRIAGSYTILFAGGGVFLDDLLERAGGHRLRVALVAMLLLFGVALAPLGLPLLSPRVTASYAAELGIVPQIERGEEKRSVLPQWLADRVGWEQLVEDVEAVVNTLEPSERSEAIIFTPSYGQAGPLEVLGRDRDLPPVYSPHNSFFLWGPPEDPVEVAVVVGFGVVGADGRLEAEDPLPWLFDELELVRVHRCEWCMPWRDQMPIWVARGQKVPFREAWPKLKFYR